MTETTQDQGSEGLVERLRERANDLEAWPDTSDLLSEAANTIARLSAANAELTRQLQGADGQTRYIESVCREVGITEGHVTHRVSDLRARLASVEAERENYRMQAETLRETGQNQALANDIERWRLVCAAAETRAAELEKGLKYARRFLKGDNADMAYLDALLTRTESGEGEP